MAANFLSSNYGLVMFATEATYKTDQIDADLNANTDVTYQLVEECTVTPTGTIVRPAIIRATHDVSEHAYIQNGASVTMSGLLTGKESAAGDPPEYAAVLKAANLEETIAASTSATYNAATVRQAGMTVCKHEFGVDGTESRLTFTTGVIGNISFNLTANTYATWSFNGTGCEFNAPSADLQYFEASTGKPLLDNGGGAVTYTGNYGYSSKSPMICKSMTVTVGGTTYNVSNVNIDVAFGTGTLDTVNGATTYSQVFNTRGDDAPVTGSFQLVSSGADYDDLLSKWPAATAAALVFTVTDGTDTISFSIPNAQLGDPSNGDVNGIRAYDIPFFGAVNSTAGDDSFSVVYT